MIPFGLKLTAWRKATQLTQSELTRLTGISRPNLSKMESGHHDPTLKTLEKLSASLGTNPANLLSDLPLRPLKLKGRHDFDKIARSIISGKRTFDSDINNLSDDIASLVENLLAAHNANGYSKVKRAHKKHPAYHLVLFHLYGEESIKRILKRIEKLL